jgi:hypothetical protein
VTAELDPDLWHNARSEQRRAELARLELERMHAGLHRAFAGIAAALAELGRRFYCPDPDLHDHGPSRT